MRRQRTFAGANRAYIKVSARCCFHVSLLTLAAQYDMLLPEYTEATVKQPLPSDSDEELLK